LNAIGDNEMNQLESLPKTEQAVIEYVKPLTVNMEAVVANYIEPISKVSNKTLRLADVAGFTKYVEENKTLNARNAKRFSKAMIEEQEKELFRLASEKLGLKVLLSRPPFKIAILDVSTTSDKRTITLTTKQFDNAVTIKSELLITETYRKWHGQLPITKPNVTYMIELSPQDYVGALPEFAIQATAQAVEVGLIPKIWIAGNRRELAEYMRSEITSYKIDPIVVGYAKYPSSKCLMIACWGTDLETMDSYFK
jgi:hypothetical protein